MFCCRKFFYVWKKIYVTSAKSNPFNSLRSMKGKAFSATEKVIVYASVNFGKCFDF
jgi:hypothetical protein